MASAMSNTQLRVLVAVGALVATIGLSACSVDATPAETTKPAAEKTDSSSSSDTQKETTPAKTPDAEIPAIPELEDALNASRSLYESAITRTEDCSNGTVAINDPGSVIAVKGSCKSVSVSGEGTIVLADDIDALNVSGTGTVTFAKSIGSAEISGTGNMVTWESGTPKVSDTGTGNVTQAIK